MHLAGIRIVVDGTGWRLLPPVDFNRSPMARKRLGLDVDPGAGSPVSKAVD